MRWWIEGYTLRLLRYHKINYRRRRGYITNSLQNNSRVFIKHKWSPGCFPVIEYATIPYISQYLKTSISYKDWRMTNSTYNVYVTHFHKSDFLHLEGICFAISNEVFWSPPKNYARDLLILWFRHQEFDIVRVRHWHLGNYVSSLVPEKADVKQMDKCITWIYCEPIMWPKRNMAKQNRVRMLRDVSLSSCWPFQVYTKMCTQAIETVSKVVGLR